MSQESERSLTARYAERILRDVLRQRWRSSRFNTIRGHSGDSTHADLPSWTIPDGKVSGSVPPPIGKIGIIGAGAAGLRLAMLCEKHGFDYEILEASDRVGGRLFTYEFPEGTPTIQHNYYDVGAMRIPDIKIMQPLLKLIDDLGLSAKRKDYYFDNNAAPNLYFNATISSADISTIVKPLQDAVMPMVVKLMEDFDAGFEALKLLDKYSTRQYLMQEKGMKFEQIQYIETFNTGTGIFDQSFTETVLRVYEFNIAKQWYRLDGGLQQVATTMHDTLKHKALLNKRVDRLAFDKSAGIVSVHVAGETSDRTYHTVFCTTTMANLSNMDTSRLDLSVEQQTAIRALGYDRSCKVAIKFSRNWWADLGAGAGLGGSSFTDLPIRTTVFPSWLDTDPSQPAVLICSYTWAQDATRIGALIKSDTDPTANAELLDLIFQNLSRVFSNKISASELKKLMVAHHAYAWSHDKHMGGAFAMFGPDQFEYLYPAFTDPAANGHFYLAGECMSAHHAWIVGALDSADCAYLKFLRRNQRLEKMAALKHSTFMGARDELPEETMDDLIHWQVQLAIDEVLED